MAGTISMGARREVLAAVAERYRAAGRREKGRILDELCATTGLASQACGAGAVGEGLEGSGRGDGIAPAQVQVRMRSRTH